MLCMFANKASRYLGYLIVEDKDRSDQFMQQLSLAQLCTQTAVEAL